LVGPSAEISIKPWNFLLRILPDFQADNQLVRPGLPLFALRTGEVGGSGSKKS
jgi:hypothetical protein